MFVAAHLGARVWGGAERAVTRLLQLLGERGHRVLLYCNGDAIASRAAALGVPTAIERLGGDVAVHHALRFARRLRRDRPDALIVGTFKKLWLASLAARLAGVPRTIARIGLESDTPRSAKYRFVMRRWVDAIVLTADAARDGYLRALPEMGSRIITIHTGVEAPVHTRAREEVRRSLGIPAGAPLAGAVARLVVQKRFDRLLNAMRDVPPDVHLVLAGDGGRRASLEDMSRRLELQDRVHFLGRRDDVPDILGALDVFVVSSDKEGLSNSMLEALALGVPVVSTAVSGAPEALAPFADGTAPGVIVDLEPKALAGAIRHVLEDAGRRRRMSEAARRRARERFDVQQMVDAWERVLRGMPASE